MKKLIKTICLLFLTLLFFPGCIRSVAGYRQPHMIRTSELLPEWRDNIPSKELVFPVVIEQFFDGRPDRATVGYDKGGSVSIVADKDIAPLFETIVAKEMQQKGIKTGPSIFILKGTIKRMSAGNLYLSETIAGEVAVELLLYNSKTMSQLWSKSYTGKGLGKDFQAVFAQAFHDLRTSIRQDNSIIELKEQYLASAGKHLDTGRKVPDITALKSSEREIDDIPDIKAEKKSDNFAIVVGIEKYRDVKGVDFAVNDAVMVQKYLIKLMGYPEENVMLITNERATKSDIEKYFGRWLKNRVDEKSTVFIYYAGHGAPDPKTGEAYLVPYDGDPNYVDTTAYPIKNLYVSLSELPAREIVVVLDSCFSGSGGRSVIAKGVRPLVMTMESRVILKGNTVVFAAAGGSQISTFYEKAGHGLFTYFFLKGLKGEADTDKNGGVTVEELYRYIRPNVEKEARLQNIEQTPVILPDIDELKNKGRIRLR